jgi:hypothetical protein
MAFVAPKMIAPIEEVVAPYVSGYSTEEEEAIRKARDLIYKRDLSEKPVTFIEFRDVIVPWYRINRTEEFILHPEKVKKVREPKAPKVLREPKVKALTKKQTELKFQGLIMKLATKQPFTEEEEIFYKEQIGG